MTALVARHMENALIVPLDLIDPHPANVREYLGDLTELAESIRSKGVLQAVVVRPHDGRFQLITGHRRCAAARIVGRKEVPALVRVAATDADVIEDMLVENMHRRRLNPIEEGNAFQALINRGRTQGDVAKAVGVSLATINHRLALLELTDVEQRAIVNKAMTLGEGWQLVHERRWERGERRGQGHHGGTEARPRWVPHFNADHRLAEQARAHCRRTHAAARSTKLADVACGPCWEVVIRADAVTPLRDFGVDLPHPAQRAPVDLAGPRLSEPELDADLREGRAVEEPGDHVAVVSG